jgi:hypothetical protein
VLTRSDLHRPRSVNPKQFVASIVKSPSRSTVGQIAFA